MEADQGFGLAAATDRRERLRVAPVVYHGDLLNAAYGAARGAGFLGEILAAEVFYGIVL